MHEAPRGFPVIARPELATMPPVEVARTSRAFFSAMECMRGHTSGPTVTSCYNRSRYAFDKQTNPANGHQDRSGGRCRRRKCRTRRSSPRVGRFAESVACRRAGLGRSKLGCGSGRPSISGAIHCAGALDARRRSGDWSVCPPPRFTRARTDGPHGTLALAHREHRVSAATLARTRLHHRSGGVACIVGAQHMDFSNRSGRCHRCRIRRRGVSSGFADGRWLRRHGSTVRSLPAGDLSDVAGVRDSRRACLVDRGTFALRDRVGTRPRHRC